MNNMHAIRKCGHFLLALSLIAVSVQADDLEKGRDAIRAGEYKKALRLLKPLAEKGIARAQNALGILYREGWGVKQDYKKALKWFRNAAEQNDALAFFNLAKMHSFGLGVKQDHNTAMKLYLQAADRNYAPAQVMIGAMYATGSGVEKDYIQALAWYTKAAEQNEAEAQRRIGLMYAEGQGVEKDDEKAVQWYRKAAENGNVVSMLMLSKAYREGSLGLRQDPLRAEQWYEKATLTGLPEVNLNLDSVREFAEGAQSQLAAFGPTPPAPFMEGATEFQRFREQVDEVAGRLEFFLVVHPDNVQALILRARMGHLQDLLEPIVITASQGPPDPAEKHSPLHAALDRALELDPDNSEAHYWKARLYGVQAPVIREGVFYKEPVDIEQAIHFTRRAVELAPGNVSYREALALYLIANQQPDQAMAVVRDIQDGKHPIHQLLSDWSVIPIPDSAVFLPDRSERLAQRSASEAELADYPNLRVRAYALPILAVEVEKFYRSRWPKFRFFEMERESSKSNEMHWYGQLLYWRKQGLEPASQKKEIQADDPPEGVALVIMEIHRPSPEVRSQFPFEVGDVVCLFVITNYRSTR